MFKASLKLIGIWFLPLLYAIPNQAQSCDPLQSASSSGLESLLAGDNKIKNVCLLSESEDFISVRVEYEGFKDKDYKITGKILDSAKRPLSEFEEVSIDLGKGGSSADLQFEFKKANKAYSNSGINSKYLSVNFASGSSPFSDLEIGGAAVFGTSALYKLERSWSVSGGGGDNSKVTINVKLTPYKNASTIKP